MSNSTTPEDAAGDQAVVSAACSNAYKTAFYVLLAITATAVLAAAVFAARRRYRKTSLKRRAARGERVVIGRRQPPRTFAVNNNDDDDFDIRDSEAASARRHDFRPVVIPEIRIDLSPVLSPYARIGADAGKSANRWLRDESGPSPVRAKSSGFDPAASLRVARGLASSTPAAADDDGAQFPALTASPGQRKLRRQNAQSAEDESSAREGEERAVSGMLRRIATHFHELNEQISATLSQLTPPAPVDAESAPSQQDGLYLSFGEHLSG